MVPGADIRSIEEAGMKYQLLRIIIAFLACLPLPAVSQAIFRASEQAGATSGTTTVITLAVGAHAERTTCGSITPGITAGAVGDLLIAQVIAKDSNATVTMTGWNTLYSDTASAVNYKVFLFWRSATSAAANGDPRTIAQAGTSCNMMMSEITRFSNVDTSQPLETFSGGAAFSNANNVDTGTQAINVVNSMLVLADFVADNRTVTQDSSFTQLYDIADASGTDAALSLNYRYDVTTGTKGPFLNMPLSGTGSDPNTGVLFAVRPAPVPNTNTLAINVPAGTASGDVMLASIAVRPSSVSIVAPSGWTLIQQVQQTTGTTQSQTTYYRVADGSEPASYTWTFYQSHTGAAGGILSFSGVDTVTPINANAGQATASSTTHIAPTVTNTELGMLVTVHEFASAVGWSPPGGMIEAVDVPSQTPANAVGISMEINYEPLATIGATGTRTATAASDADTGTTQSIVLSAPSSRFAVASNNWDNTATWSASSCAGASGAAVPAAGANVVICSTRTVTLNTNTANLASLTIQGTGVLNIGDSGTARTLTVAGNVSNAGTLRFNTNAAHIATIGGNLTNSGTLTSAAVAGAKTLTVTGAITNSGTFRFAGTAAMTVNANGGIDNSNIFDVDTASNLSHALNVATDINNTGTFDLATDANSLANTTFTGGITHTITGNAAMRFNNVTVNNNLTVNKTAGAITQTGTFTVNGNLNVQAGTLNLANATTVTGTTDISGTLGHTTTTGARLFTGAVTISGTWNNSANHAITMENSLTNDGTFTSGSGTYTFQTTSGAVWAGTSGLSFGGAVNVNANRSNNTTTSITGVLTVANGVTLTNNSTATVSGNIVGGGATATLTNATNSTLNAASAVLATGVLTASASGNTVNYNGAAQTVKLPSGAPATYYNLTLSGSGTAVMPGTAMTISNNFLMSGTVTTTAGQAMTVGNDFDVNTNNTFSASTFAHTIGDDLTIGGTYNAGTNTLGITGDFTDSGTFTGSSSTVSVGGNFSNSGTFTANTSTFNFNGSSAQTLGGTAAGTTTFNNLTLNNANGLSLTGTHNATVGATLTLTSGRFASGGNLVTANGTVSRGGGCGTTNCFVVGNLTKPIGAGTPTVGWEVGTETASPAYTPVSIAFTGAAAGTFRVTTPTASGDHADTIANANGIDPANSVNQYWTLTTGTATFTSYAPTFTYANIDGGATPATFVIAQESLGEWTYPPLSGTPTATTATATGVVSATGDVFTIGSATLHVAAYSEWRMDEGSWNGTANEVGNNGSGAHTGTAAGLAATKPTTSAASSPISGSPGTCLYGVFNRTNKDYIALPGGYPNLSAGPGPTSFTITAWIRSTNVALGAQRIMIDDEGNANGNWGFSLGDGGSGMLRFYYRQAASFTLDTAAVITNNTWFFVAAAVNLKSGTNNSRASIFVYNTSGTLVAAATNSFTVTSFGADATPPSLGGETNAAGENTNAFGFAGNLDEVRVYRTAYSAQQVNQIRQLTRTCALIDHIRLVHDGEGLTCTPESVTVQACADAACSSFYTGSVDTTLSPTGWVGGDSISFSGGSTSVQLRHTVVETVTLGADTTSPAPVSATTCSNTSVPNTSCNMDFVDSGFIFDVPNLTSCKTSANVTLSAVKKSDSGVNCAPAFTGNRTINFWSSYISPNSGTQSMTVSGTTVGTASPGTGVTLNFNGSGQADITVNYPDAGQVQLNARFQGSGSESGLDMTGNDQFVAVPHGIAVYPDTGTCNGTTAASGVICAAAGAPFNLNVKAACWTSDADTNFSDNPVTPNFQLTNIPVTHSLVLPVGGQNGTLGTSNFDFVAADNGVHVISQTISEVGVFTFTATPPAYFGNAIAAATSSSMGRFRPGHFALSGGTLINRVDAGCASLFTYMGENLRLGFTLTARNTGNTTTQNYRGAFAKLDPTDIAALNIGAIDSVAPTALSLRVATVAATGAWGTPSEGVVDILATVALNRAAAPDGPYTDVRFGIAPADSDGVGLNAYDLDINNDAVDDRGLISASQLRYGRMFLENASGSELVPLTIPLRAEYYRGGQFVLNTNDSCTSYNSADVSFNNRVDLNADPAASGADTLNGGLYVAPIQLSAPGAGDTGSVDAILNVPTYLLYDWDNDGSNDDDPKSKATFGIYGPDNKQIYIREVY